MLKVHWHSSNNFGDCITPYLVEQLTGKSPEFSSQDKHEPRYMIIGSLLNAAHDKTIVWGTGMAWGNKKIKSGIDFRAVRGPLSRNVAISSGNSCPEVYGDPALFMPKLYNPAVEKIYKIGFIPHFIERETKYKLDGDSLVIDLSQGILKVINQMLSCKKIVSSSLHGLIVADAYGIPSQWMKLTNGIIGDGTKFYDHMLAMNMETYEPWDLRGVSEYMSSKEMYEKIPDRPKSIDLKKLWEACPFLDECSNKLY